jgi:hypothetical protein
MSKPVGQESRRRGQRKAPDSQAGDEVTRIEKSLANNDADTLSFPRKPRMYGSARLRGQVLMSSI